MLPLLENSTSTAKSTPILLPTGHYKILAAIPEGDAASVKIFQRVPGTTTDMPVNFDGEQVELTHAAPSQIVISTGEFFLVQRTGGSAAITVVASALNR